MTKQQMVDKVYEVFITNKTKASIKGDLCQYGDPDKSAGCAVACLVSHKTRSSLHELESSGEYPCNGLTVDNYKVKALLPKKLLLNLPLLSSLQFWHDQADAKHKRLNTRERIDAFKHLCEDYGLKFPGDRR